MRYAYFGNGLPLPKSTWSLLSGNTRRKARQQAFKAAAERQARKALNTGNIKLPPQRGEFIERDARGRAVGMPSNFVERNQLANPTWNNRINKAASRQRSQEVWNKGLADTNGGIAHKSKPTRQERLDFHGQMGSLSPADRKDLVFENKQRVLSYRRAMLDGPNLRTKEARENFAPRFGHDQSHGYPSQQGKANVGITPYDENYIRLYESAIDNRRHSRRKQLNSKQLENSFRNTSIVGPVTEPTQELRGILPDEFFEPLINEKGYTGKRKPNVREIDFFAQNRVRSGAHRGHEAQLKYAWIRGNQRDLVNGPYYDSLRRGVRFSADGERLAHFGRFVDVP